GSHGPGKAGTEALRASARRAASACRTTSGITQRREAPPLRVAAGGMDGVTRWSPVVHRRRCRVSTLGRDPRSADVTEVLSGADKTNSADFVVVANRLPV